MKKVIQFGLYLILALSSFQSPAQSKDYVDGETLYCLAINGLSIRVQPSKDFLKNGVISYGDSVKFIKSTGAEETIDGFNGEWIEVMYEGVPGYIFDVYASKFPAPRPKKNGYPHIIDYLISTFELTKGDKSFNIEDASMNVYNESFQFGDITYVYNNEGHDAIETIIIPNGNIQECLIVFTASTSVFRKYSFDHSKFKKVIKKEGLVEYKSYDLKDPENSGEGYVYAYSLNDSGTYSFLEIDFEWEMGGSWFKCEKLEDQSVKVSHGYYSH